MAQMRRVVDPSRVKRLVYILMGYGRGEVGQWKQEKKQK